MTEEASSKAKPRMTDVPRDIEPYFVGLLRKGDRWNDVEGEDAPTLMPRHLAFLREQTEAGRYLLAGPITGDESLVGLLIIAGNSAEEARAIAAADPGVQSGRLTVEVYPAFLPSLKGLRVTYSPEQTASANEAPKALE
jgi:uncharacterized protein YciI